MRTVFTLPRLIARSSPFRQDSAAALSLRQEQEKAEAEVLSTVFVALHVRIGFALSLEACQQHTVAQNVCIRVFPVRTQALGVLVVQYVWPSL